MLQEGESQQKAAMELWNKRKFEDLFTLTYQQQFYMLRNYVLGKSASTNLTINSDDKGIDEILFSKDTPTFE